MRIPMPLRFRLLCLALGCLALAACSTTVTAWDPAVTGPLYQPDNYVGVARLPDSIRRVVFLPLSGGDVVPAEISAEMTPIFTAALQRENRFEVVALSRAECRQALGGEEFRSTATLPHDFMEQLRTAYAADAVMLVDLTVLRTLRPLTLGVRAKLATTDATTVILWNFDEVLSTGEPAVANSARRFYLYNDAGLVPVDRSDAILQSPTRFAAYVAATTFATLPPR